MKIAPMGEVRNNFAKYLNACEDEPVFVTKNGRIASPDTPSGRGPTRWTR